MKPSEFVTRRSVRRTLVGVDAVVLATWFFVGGPPSAQEHGHPMVYSPPAGPPPVYDNGTSAAGIELGTPVRAMGAGAETRDAWLLSHVTYSLPGVTLKDQSVTAISFRHLEPTSGHRMDGVLGADFLK